MNSLIEILADIIGTISGKKANTAFEAGRRKSSYIWLTLLLLVVLGMGVYAFYSLARMVMAK